MIKRWTVNENRQRSIEINTTKKINRFKNLNNINKTKLDNDIRWYEL